MDRIKFLIFFIAFGLSNFFVHGQEIGNYVRNGSFEECSLSNCTPIWDSKAKFWGPIDSLDFCYDLYSIVPPNNNAPYGSYGFQFPRTGNQFILTAFYCSVCTYYVSRGYPRTLLKEPLKPNTAYCVKYHVVNTNNCVVGIDRYGAYFGDNSLDTIKNSSSPLYFLNPQIENPTGTIITDTLNWIPVTGTFVANGTEKYMVLGNFNSDANTNTLVINPTYLPTLATDLYIEDVSVIELNLAAYAGPDKLCLPGDSVYIGRELDWAIDPYCIWYKLPNMTTAIDTTSGLWVKPATTSTYIVRQELECGSVKWDTVVVPTEIIIDETGLNQIQRLSDNIKLFPNPTSGNLNISFFGSVPADIRTYSLTDNLGRLIKMGTFGPSNSSVDIETSNLPPGLYQIRFDTRYGPVTKKLVKTTD
jgi:hypothetical protein